VATLGWLLIIAALLLVVAVLNNSWIPLGAQLRDAFNQFGQTFGAGSTSAPGSSSPESAPPTTTSPAPADTVQPGNSTRAVA
jgi:hypothetical protein